MSGHRASFRRAPWGLNECVGAILVTSLLLAGCGGTKKISTQPVTGKVTFQGAAVEEGVITFEDAAKGHANSANLGVGGAYTINLPEGAYVVSVIPPMVQIGGGPDTPPDEGPKQVDNIPDNYRSSKTSPLKAQVSSGSTTHDFDMTP